MKRAIILTHLVLFCVQAAAHSAETLFVARPGRIDRLVDLNGDGDFLDFAEITNYADSLPQSLGALLHTDEALYVIAGQPARILAIKDLNADGDALDFAEVQTFAVLPDFSSLPRGLARMPDGALLTAREFDGTLFRIHDDNADGDALDLNEVTAVASGLTSPKAIAVRPDGILLILQDSAATPMRILHDRNGDGDYFDFAENLPYAENIAGCNDLSIAAVDVAFLTRTTQGELLKIIDHTRDDDALDFNEVQLYATALTSPTLIAIDDQALIVASAAPAGTLLAVRDINGDGDALDYAEVIEIANGLTAVAGIAIPATQYTTPCIPGDYNNDGSLTTDDIVPFVRVLIGLDAPPEHCRADLNDDSRIDARDIPAFVNALLNS
ncbi:MAG: hypothetical protein KF841_05220 [Phycisphaerae bacterium]|nr:hypothetical protein [Phycisphaerae bacterium]